MATKGYNSYHGRMSGGKIVLIVVLALVLVGAVAYLALQNYVVYDEAGNATLSLRNKFRTGEELEAVGPDTRPFAFAAPEIFLADGTPVEEPKTPQTILKMKLPQAVPVWSLLRRRVELSAK